MRRVRQLSPRAPELFKEARIVNFKMAAAIAPETTEAASELTGEAHSPQLGSGALDLESISLPATSNNSEAGKAHKRSYKVSTKGIKSKKSTKSTSRFEKQKARALECICKKASSKKTLTSHSTDKRQHSQGRLSLQLSPEGRADRENYLNSLFPIDVSGIWGLNRMHRPHSTWGMYTAA